MLNFFGMEYLYSLFKPLLNTYYFRLNVSNAASYCYLSETQLELVQYHMKFHIAFSRYRANLSYVHMDLNLTFVEGYILTSLEHTLNNSMIEDKMNENPNKRIELMDKHETTRSYLHIRHYH
jgi:hypothetical protein